MLRKKFSCAVAGVALACAAAFSLSLLAQSEVLTNLDLRWFHVSKKGDRLPVRAPTSDDAMISFDLSAHRMTVVTKVSARQAVESAVQFPRPASVRHIPVQPVRELRNDRDVKKERLPEGCEPAFSPVTTPAFAHIGVRCDS
jgi:hypothetical protein